MGDGFWSDASGEGEYFGIPGEGCFYRKLGGDAFWVTGGAHNLYGKLNYERGPLGMPISNWDDEQGFQEFEHGVIIWDGDEFRLGDTSDAKPFDMPRPPAVPV